jgi:hypothetical protein
MTASDNILIYDNTCPVCSGYTRLFVKMGLLAKSGRRSFSEIEPEILEMVDNAHCKNEIPLVNLSSHEVKYGIEAMVTLLEQKYPRAGRVCRITPVNWFLRKLYKFISYNRRVIVAPKESKGFNCAPDFNLHYRLLFMLVFLVFNTIMLYPVHIYVLQHSYFNGANMRRFQQLHLALVAVNIISAFTLVRKNCIEYLGQVNMLALIVLLLLIPLTVINHSHQLPEWSVNAFLCGLALFTLNEYIRRMKYAGTWKNRPLIAINAFSILLFLILLT